jgi:hypothetical protein
MIRFLISLLVILLWGGFSSQLQANIQLSDETPVKGESVAIQLDEPVSQVIVTYRPNSLVAKTDTLRQEEPQQLFSWTPKWAGVVSLSTESSSKNVSVRFAGIAWSGIVVMAVAALFLFGGVAFAFSVLFSEDEEIDLDHMDISHRPDT